MLGDMISDIFV